jgi:hypothetical protein
MDINYELIIKYLANSKKPVFASKKFIQVSSETFPDNFKEILQNKFYRYGVTQLDNKNNNISFYNSLLTLLNKQFITYSLQDEIVEINNFKKSISLNELDIQYISDNLDVNFLIFDFKSNEINVIFSGVYCNPYKNTLLLANFEDQYEPIINETDNKRLFSYNDIIIKKIYQSDLKSTKPFKLVDNLKEIITEMSQTTTFIKPVENEYDEKKLNKMTKKELEEILEKKNIKINVSKTLKKDIIELILK